MEDLPLFLVLKCFKEPDDITTINNSDDHHNLLSSYCNGRHED